MVCNMLVVADMHLYALRILGVHMDCNKLLPDFVVVYV